MDWKIELIPVPVTDVDAAKSFYVGQVGFTADHDHRVSPELRFVQLTPVGSACSIVMGEGITTMTPGSQEIQIVVADADAAFAHLAKNNVDATPVEDTPWGRFVYFRDPDGNKWSLQQIVPQG
ncbi:MAG: glyoxalase superfamily protein [Rhodoglobus sp.]